VRADATDRKRDCRVLVEEIQLSGTVNISLPIAFGRVALLPVMSRFREHYHQVTVDMRLESRPRGPIARRRREPIESVTKATRKV